MVNIKIIEDSLNKWIEEQYLSELSENTLKQYRNAVMKFISYLKSNSINNVNKNEMLNYKTFLNQISESENSKNVWIISLNKYLKWLEHSDLCLQQLNVQQRFSNYDNMSLSDYKRLLRFAKKTNRIQDYYIIKTLAMTGVRISELKYFTVEKLKKQNDNILHIYNKKKARDIPLRDDLARELRKYCRSNKIETGVIFVSPIIPNKMINQATIWKHLKKIAGMARVKLKVVHAHSFRHLFADVFFETYPGGTLILADLLGHNSLETTRLYTRKTLHQQKKILSNLKFNDK